MISLPPSSALSARPMDIDATPSAAPQASLTNAAADKFKIQDGDNTSEDEDDSATNKRPSDDEAEAPPAKVLAPSPPARKPVAKAPVKAKK